MPTRTRVQTPAINVRELGDHVEHRARGRVFGVSRVPRAGALPRAPQSRGFLEHRLAILRAQRAPREVAAAFVGAQPVLEERRAYPRAKAKGAVAHSGSAAL